MARVWLGGLVAAVVVGTCFVARADGPTAVVRDDDSLTRDHARELFLHGIELSDQVRWAEALDWFRESYVRRAAAAPLLNIGIALRAIGRHREAAETFTQFLAVFGGRNAEHDRLARQYRDEALGSVARVRVRGLPRGASLSVDGRAARGERAGDEVVVVVDPGEHVVMARSRDGRTVRETVRLVPGD
ncbi:MAG: tetratricopeptide repeat protein, partial [Deltaproteobacteria bacterium]|nr:tetratricopeptide repeat protein [Deltaproteobacteria bacterium]